MQARCYATSTAGSQPYCDRDVMRASSANLYAHQCHLLFWRRSTGNLKYSSTRAQSNSAPVLRDDCPSIDRVSTWEELWIAIEKHVAPCQILVERSTLSWSRTLALLSTPKETSLAAQSYVVAAKHECSALVCEVSNLINPAAAKPAASSLHWMIPSRLVNVVVACRRSSRRRRPRAMRAKRQRPCPTRACGRNKLPHATGLTSKSKTRCWELLVFVNLAAAV